MKRKYKMSEAARFGKDLMRLMSKVGPDMAEKGIRECVALTTAEAKRRAPVGIHRKGHRAGAMRQSIAFRVKRRGALVQGAVGSDEPQAKFTEFGTKHIQVGTGPSPRTSWPAKAKSGAMRESMPWLRAAIWANRGRFTQIWKRIVRKGR